MYLYWHNGYRLIGFRNQNSIKHIYYVSSYGYLHFIIHYETKKLIFKLKFKVDFTI